MGIFLTQEETEKIKIIDKIFSSYTVSELKQQFGEALTVEVLSGVPIPLGFFQMVIDNHNRLQTEFYSCNSQVMMLKNDMKDLIKAVDILSRPPTYYTHANPELQNLKSKNNIY